MNECFLHFLCILLVTAENSYIPTLDFLPDFQSWEAPLQVGIEDNGNVSFSGQFTNGAVLQRGSSKKPSRAAIYGKAPQSATVNINMRNQDGSYTKSGSIKSNQDGQWKWVLPEWRPAGGNYTFMLSCTECPNKEIITNVTFGDVWFCAGQSNMFLPMEYTFQRNISWQDYQSGSYRNIRLFNPGHNYVNDESASWLYKPDPSRQWIVDIPLDKFNKFSALCWYFGQELTNQLGADASPLGLINAAIGGTTVEIWSRNGTLMDCKNHGKPKGMGQCFNGQVAPFVNYTIKGVIWYQGENNVRGDNGNILENSGYPCMFNAMKNDWMKLWSAVKGTTDPLFPFGIVTLAPDSSEGNGDIRDMRWAQTLNYGVVPNPAFPNGFMANAYDIGDPWNTKGCKQHHTCQGWGLAVPYSISRTPFYMGPIHPRMKYEVGRRLAVASLNPAYGIHTSPIAGPTIQSCHFEVTQTSKSINVQFSIQFDPKYMKPSNISDKFTPVITASVTQPFPHSAFKVMVDNKWVNAYIRKAQISTDGKISLSYTNSENIDKIPTRLSYAWGGCCDGIDNSFIPCMPKSCPLMQKLIPSSKRVLDHAKAIDEGLPANPFMADLILDDKTSGHCQCTKPQICG